jgi:hypothetical protein
MHDDALYNCESSLNPFRVLWTRPHFYHGLQPMAIVIEPFQGSDPCHKQAATATNGFLNKCPAGLCPTNWYPDAASLNPAGIEQ